MQKLVVGQDRAERSLLPGSGLVKNLDYCSGAVGDENISVLSDTQNAMSRHESGRPPEPAELESETQVGLDPAG